MKEKSVRLVVLGIMLVLLASAAVGTASAKQEGNIFTPDYKPKDEVDNLTYLLAAKGLSERDLEDMKDYFTYSENDRNEVDPYSNPNLGKFFNGKEESRSKQYIRKAGKLVKKHGPAAVIAGLFFAAPIACVGLGNVNVASASSADNIEDAYDDTIESLGTTPLQGMDFFDFKAVDKPLNEPIKYPDEITKSIRDNYEKRGTTTVKVSPTDFAVWIGVSSEKTGLIESYLVYLDTDGDGKPEELAALYNYPYKESLFSSDCSSIKGHYKFVPGGYLLMYGKDIYHGDFGVVINPFDIPKEEMGSLHKMLYIENPDKIQVLPDKTIPWKNAIGKTPAELGLDKDDRGIFGRPPNQTSSPAESTPSEVPKGEEKGIPGFEALFAIVGLLAVAYVLRRRSK